MKKATVIGVIKQQALVKVTKFCWVHCLLLGVRHVDAHMPKSSTTEEHQNNEQLGKAVKNEVAQMDFDWKRKAESKLFEA